MTPTYTTVIAHVYSSVDSYHARSRRLSPVYPSPSAGALTISVGRPPRWLFRARRRLHELNLLRGGSLEAWLDGGPDPPFNLRGTRLDRPWYVTLVLELLPQPLDARQLDVALEKESIVSEAAVMIAANSSADVIQREELRGLFFQRGDGKWVKYPEFSLYPPTLGVSRAKGQLQRDVGQLRVALDRWNAGARELRTEWAHRALLADDQWSEFIWLMFSLERSLEDHNSVFLAIRPEEQSKAEQFYKAVVTEGKAKWAHPAVTLKFAFVAACLAPESAIADVTTFHFAKKLRDDMLHGIRAKAPDGSTRLTLRELALRYHGLVTTALGRQGAGEA